ncbi:MAG: vWA domain-containing protein, partial [Pirellulales bacterium]
TAPAAIPATRTAANAQPATARASSLPAPLADLPPLNLDLAEMAASDVATSSRDMLRGMKTGDLGTESPFIPPRSAREGGVAAADGVDEAVAGILGDIDGRLAEGNLLVVWLLDASISLVDDRRQIAQRLEPFYQGIGIRDKKTQTVFSNAVVAFGNQTKELVKPTHFNGKIVRAVNNVPIDESGLENVMTAVEQCVHKYRGRWKDDMLIVVWTDESGDDILRLEQTIRLCREQRVVVTVVGPSSVLGSERGSHQYTDPASGFSFLLPVKRGPDTSLPERLMIPYWHASLFNAWQKNGAVVAQGVQGFGGPHRERLLSGFGPYALTRLALQTGGSFTLLDRPADRGPFDLHKLRDYLPDYNAAEHYLQETQSQPLRQAVSTAVMRTYHEAFSHPPTMGFFGAGAMRYPFGMSAVYLPPTRFRDMLAESLPAEERRAAAALRIIEQGLADFDGQTDYEALYEEEDSRRWRAWYDLTRGRLLANSVRYQEYLLACQLVRNGAGQNSETNHVVLRPAEEFISQGSRQRAEQAGRLLNRCIEENPSTPWALLAQWELEYPLGLRIESSVIPRPPPAVAAPAAGAGGGGVSLPKL